MKEFRKNKQGFYVCEECEKFYKNKSHLCIHIKSNHIPKIYYDIHIKSEDDGLCKICKKESEFISVGQGYKNCCSTQHGYDYNHLKIRLANMQKYGVENISKLDFIKKKKKETCLSNHGVTAGFADHKKRVKKFIETCLLKYGVENPSQYEEIFNKQQKSRWEIKKYKDTNVNYQGSYELDFLQKYYDIFENITRAPSIKYKLNNKNKIYFPDFYIPSLNLIIEIKNKNLAIKDHLKIEEKKKATISNGFNYIMIVEKNYNEFIKKYIN